MKSDSEDEKEPNDVEETEEGAVKFDHRIAQRSTESVKLSHSVTLGDNDSEIFCVKFDKDDKYVACGCADGKIKIFNLETNKMAFLLANPEMSEFELMPITSL
jgi:WD40 repeat protein